ncbi:hypothetical protein OW763_13965 [Clostridium aestuarii]|uniref:DUF4230 domain-containing protein n=1 Tax=Clostridium aestuarii TaxID=338193 RepID=A0ABT4D2H4_9CLOT|nr:hypothetical protein [Clostridium aestuarii]MCY6485436.1 hypothetical protein [Clostridium aestuarii]
MKRIRVRIIFSILLGVIVLIYLYTTLPRTYSKSFEGIKYRLGETNNQFIEKVSISINGKLSKNFIFGKKFVGKIKINDLEIPKEIEEIELKFDNFNRASIDYFFSNEQDDSFRAIYGTIYIDDDFSQLTIGISEPEDLYANSKHWDSINGLMISAPASNRKRALEISNNLMKDVLYKDLQ